MSDSPNVKARKACVRIREELAVMRTDLNRLLRSLGERDEMVRQQIVELERLEAQEETPTASQSQLLRAATRTGEVVGKIFEDAKKK